MKYNLKTSLTFFLSLFLILDLPADTITLKGNAPSYSEDRITFYTYLEFFAYTQQDLCTLKVDEKGNFECSFNSKETIKVFADLGIFSVHFYAEPGKIYDLVLPEKVEKEMKDQLNPYFQPVEIHLGIKGAKDDDLNVMIRMFNDSYVPYFNKHVINVASNQDFSKLNDDIAKFTDTFKKYNHPYFQNYIRYRIGLLRFLAEQNKSKKISNEYFIDEKIDYSNPAYMELFNQVYDGYFTHLGRTEDGKKIYSDINQEKNLDALKATLKKDKILSDNEITELVILKNIYDEFYSNKFSRSALLEILEALIAETDNEKHKDIGTKIKNKITLLLSGYPPPDFELYDQDSNLVRLSNRHDKYIYLNFCASHSYSCIQEYEALKYLFEKHNERLDIITVSTDNSFETMVKSRKKMNCPWTFVYFGNDPGVLDKYDIRAFPTYFLIDKDGKLVRSPAPSPGENIEKTLFEVMRSRGEI